MKHLTLIVHTDIQQELTQELRALKVISGFTLSPVEGHGMEVEDDPFLSARDKVVGSTPRIRADILVELENIELLLSHLRQSIQDIDGNGIYWITDVEQSGRL